MKGAEGKMGGKSKSKGKGGKSKSQGAKGSGKGSKMGAKGGKSGHAKAVGTENIGTYRRKIPNVNIKAIRDKKLQAAIKKKGVMSRAAAYKAVRSEILLPEESGFVEAEGMEKTYHFSQAELTAAVDQQSARKVFDIKLDELGPYTIDYTRNGRHVLLGGRKGHVASFDWKTGALGCEAQFGESVRDVCWLQNEMMFATAQKRYVYIYDNTGAEIHVLRQHVDPQCLQYLPYHFLLASVGNAGWLKYHDVSMGKLVAERRTKLGPCKVMRQNPYNAVLHLGHSNGTVTLWTPNMSTFAVKQLCHRGPVKSIAIDNQGLYMATGGLDGQLKIWDIRNFKDEPVHKYFTPTPATCVDISQRNLLAVGYGSHIQIWKGALTAKEKSPLMNHMIPGSMIEQCRFSPFEDVLGIGHANGFSSILVPGAGEPNFDAMENNVYETKSQRKETEVKQILEKIQPELISLNPNDILKVVSAKSELDGEDEATDGRRGRDGPENTTKKARGRNSAKRRFLRKKTNVITAERQAYKEKLDAEQRKKERATTKKDLSTALQRFAPRPQ